MALSAVFILDMTNLRENAIHEVRSKSKILNQDFTKIALYGDINIAADISSKLHDFGSALNVFVYDKQGSIIFSYSKSRDLKIAPPELTKNLAYLKNDLLHVFTAVEYEGSNYGHVYMRILPEYLQAKRQEYYLIFGIGIPVLLALSYLLAVWLQDHFTRPIITLTRKMEKIASEQDYTANIKTDESYEIGSLYNSFDSLLKTIHGEQKKQLKSNQELELHRDHLEEMVAERTAELKIINKELESFSYSVSHDLRAPLRAIDGFSMAVIEDYGDKLDGEGRDNLQRIRSGAKHMAVLIDSLLQLSQVTRREIRIENVDMSALVSTSLNKMMEVESGRTLDQIIARGIYAHGDSTLLETLLSNLLGNAWKYTSKTDNARIEFGVTQEDGENIFFIKDNGVGFDMQYADKLFGAFQRFHREEEFSGTGIGLATVQRIVHRHGGRVWARAEKGSGATFFFTLGLALLPKS